MILRAQKMSQKVQKSLPSLSEFPLIQVALASIYINLTATCSMQREVEKGEEPISGQKSAKVFWTLKILVLLTKSNQFQI